MAHADPEKAPAIEALSKLPPDLEAPALIAHAIRERRTVVQKAPRAHGRAEPEEPLSGIGNPEVMRLLERLGLQEYVTVPLVARERVIGALTAATTEVQQSFDREDIQLLEDLALRMALQLDNARLHHELLVANQAKSDFLAVMSHELRTPLTAIIGYADLIESGVSGPLTGKQRQQLDRIKASSDHLRALIEEILTFSRLDVGREDVQTERVDLAELVADVAAIVEPLVNRKGLNMVQHVPDKPTMLTTDSKKVRQILLNLLSNAVKFTAAGEIEMNAAVEGEDIVITVRDTGIGIGAASQEKIFDPFWQVDRGTTRSAGGAGLGLTVSRRLARLMGGDITVSSSPESGSVFTLRLPAFAEVEETAGL
jgi:signal transduction histidine kinase